jgi:pimeloyl-ACP methyl ester carboxylesterase
VPASEPEPQVQFLTVHGYRRAFIRAGQGPALLLVHGIGDSSESWRPVIKYLARRYTVIAPDLLGHGQSDKPRADYSVAAYANGMRDLLSMLDVDRVTAVGHSLGGGVAAQFAYQFPERCERLVLVGSGGVGPDVSVLLRLATLPGAELIMPLFGLPVARVVSRVAGSVAQLLGTGVGYDIREVLAVFDELPDISTRQAILRTLRAAVDWRGQSITMLDRAYLTEGIPTLLVWGEHDAIIPVAHARLAHAAMIGSRLEVFEEAGHFPHHSDPLRFIDVLNSFIEETEPAQYSAEEWRERLHRGGQGDDLADALVEADLPAVPESSAS